MTNAYTRQKQAKEEVEKVLARPNMRHAIFFLFSCVIFISFLSANKARADFSLPFVQLTCVPETNYFSVQTFALGDEEKDSGNAKDNASGLFLLKKFEKKPYVCQLGKHTVSVKTAMHHLPQATGMCGGTDYGSISVTYDGTSLGNIGVGDDCLKESQNQIQVSQFQIRICNSTFDSKSDRDFMPEELKCEVKGLPLTSQNPDSVIFATAFKFENYKNFWDIMSDVSKIFPRETERSFIDKILEYQAKAKVVEKAPGQVVYSHEIIDNRPVKILPDEIFYNMWATEASTDDCGDVWSATAHYDENNKLIYIQADCSFSGFDNITSDKYLAFAQSHANKGDVIAQYNLGRIYLEEEKYEDAYYWLVLASNNQHLDMEPVAFNRVTKYLNKAVKKLTSQQITAVLKRVSETKP